MSFFVSKSRSKMQWLQNESKSKFAAGLSKKKNKKPLRVKLQKTPDQSATSAW